MTTRFRADVCPLRGIAARAELIGSMGSYFSRRDGRLWPIPVAGSCLIDGSYREISGRCSPPPAPDAN